MITKRLFGIVMAAMCCIMASADSGVSITIAQKDSAKEQATVEQEQQNRPMGSLTALVKDAPNALRIAAKVCIWVFSAECILRGIQDGGVIVGGAWNLDLATVGNGLRNGASNTLRNIAGLLGVKLACVGLLASAGAINRLI